MSKLMLGIVCGVSAMFIAAVLPQDQAGSAPGGAVKPAPVPVSQAAGATGAATVGTLAHQPPGTIEGGAPVATFELSGSGTLLHVHAPQVPGQKPFKTSIKTAMIAPCINGDDFSCNGLVTEDADGKVYLFIDSLGSWRVASNLSGDGAATLTGIVDSKGAFTMTGTDAVSGTAMVITGKMSFAKGTYAPTKISGKITAVSVGQEHLGTGKFKGTLYVPPS